MKHQLNESKGNILSQRIVSGLNRIGIVLKTNAWKGAGEENLTPTQGQILSFLSLRSGGESMLSQLAESLGITLATASRAVKTLVEKGLVKKQTSLEDARSVGISLTTKGKGKSRKVVEWPDFFLGAVDTLSNDEPTVFLRSLVKMIGSLQDKGYIQASKTCVTCHFFQPDVNPGKKRPHYCAFADIPLGDDVYQIECPDHEPASPVEVKRNLKLI